MGRFQFPKVIPTTNVTITFPKDVLEEAKRAITGKQCSFSAFVVAAVRYALEHLEEESS